MSGPSPHANPAYDALPLVGRAGEIENIETFAAQPTGNPHVIFITGEGGVGKTRLLREVLYSSPQVNAGKSRPKELVDFYHIRYHAVDHFIQGLRATLTGTGGVFEPYEDEYSEAEHAPSGKERDRHFKQARQYFLEGLRTLSMQRPVVLRMDTLERLIYGTAESNRMMEERSLAWRWLLDVLPTMGPITILMAGRRRAKPLVDELRAIQGIDLLEIDLKPLSEAESWEYLKAAAAYAYASGEEHAAQVIEQKLLRDEVTFQPFINKYSRGRPIFLALIVDFLSRAADQHIQKLIQALETDPEADGESELISRLMNDIPDNDVIRFMGYMPKGVDAALLADIMALSPTAAEHKLAIARRFALTKASDDDTLLFLHDELYALLEKHNVVQPPGYGAEAERVHDSIKNYYRIRQDEVLDRIKESYQLLEDDVDVGESLDDDNTLYQRLLADAVFYRLRQNPVKGIRRWYRYAHEAALSGNHSMNVLLELELITFLTEHQPEDGREVPNSLPPDTRNICDSLLSIGALRRAWATEDYVNVIKLAQDSRQTWMESTREHNVVLEAPLNIWEAYARVVRGQGDDVQQALELLTTTINNLAPNYEEVAFSDHDNWVWLAKAYLGFAYRVRGYTRRVQGRMEEAVHNYEQALKLFQAVNLRIESAYTLNDMGFALGEVGRYEKAVTAVKAALEERYKLGIGAYIGLSLNTQAMIHIRQGDPNSAIKLSARASKLFRGLEHRRGTGLALIARAEALRRYSSTITSVPGQINLLGQALSHAHEAQMIFTELGETPRQVEAWIETGCAYRDWVHLCIKNPQSSSCNSTTQHTLLAIEALEKAAELAGEKILYRHIDALINLTWLGYYAYDDAAMEHYIERIEADLPRGYWLSTTTGLPGCSPRDPDVQPTIWPQLAKLHVVRGHHALRSSALPEVNPDDRAAWLIAAGQYYALANAYDHLFHASHYGLDRAQRDILTHLEPFRIDPEALRWIAQGIAEMERAYDLRPYVREFLDSNGLWVDPPNQDEDES